MSDPLPFSAPLPFGDLQVWARQVARRVIFKSRHRRYCETMEKDCGRIIEQAVIEYQRRIAAAIEAGLNDVSDRKIG